MSTHRLISHSGRIVRFAAYAFAAAVVAFFAVTRTEVGRDGVRQELIRQFDRSLHGSLEIGTLSGNVVNRLSASNVVVRDSSGRPVVVIDSVVFHPSWNELFRRTVSAGRVTLVRPKVYLHQAAGAGWSIHSAFQVVSGTDPPAEWSFRSTRIDIVEGHVRSQSNAPGPEVVRNGSMFDWTNADVERISGRMLVDWEPDLKLVDVLELRGRLDDENIQIDTLRGQLVLENGALAVNEAHLRTSASTLHLNGSITPLEALQSDPGSARIGLDVVSSTLDGDELSRLFPKLNLRGRVATSARLSGPIDSIAVEHVRASTGGSEIELSGTIRSLPESIVYDLALRPSTVRSHDLRSIWPETPVPSFQHVGTVTLESVSSGTVRFAETSRPLRWEDRTDFRVESDAGGLEGSAGVAIGGLDSVQVRGRANFTSIDAGHLFDHTWLTSNLNGVVHFDAAGARFADASGRALVSLDASSWADRSVDTLSLNLSGARRAIEGTVYAAHGGSSLRAGLEAVWAPGRPSYQIAGRFEDVDVGMLLLNDSLSSALTADFELDGSGRTWTDFEGHASYAFEPSQLRYKSRLHAIPSHRSQLAIRQSDVGSPLIDVSGDILHMQVSGDVALRPLALLSRYWIGEIARSVEEERDKPYRLAGGVQNEPTSFAVPNLEADRDVAGVAPQSVDVHLQFHRSDILTNFLPVLPVLRTNLNGEASVQMDDDRFDLSLRLQADSVYLGTLTANDVRLELTADATASPSVSRTLSANLFAGASELAAGDRTLEHPSITSSYENRGFDLEIGADVPQTAAPLRLRARMDLLQDRNRLVIREFQVGGQREIWTTQGLNVVDFFQEAMYVRGIRVVRKVDERSERLPDISPQLSPQISEYLEIAGTLSSAPEDTLFVRARGVSMEHAGGLLGVESQVGGRLDGRLAFTGFDRHPELTGRVDIDQLSYRDRHLGRLTATSAYVPGSPEVALHLALAPSPPADSTLMVEESDVTVAGTFRLPSIGRAGTSQDPGSLDLDVDVARADAFFFDFLFRDLVADASGIIEGTGHVGGDFSAPVFDAALDFQQASFRMPAFGLSYELSGPVTIDRSGIHLEDVQLADSNGGDGVVGGSILFNEYRYFSFDLAAELDDVVVMNVPQSRDLPFYGRIYASGGVRLSGPISNALLESSNIRASPESDLFIPISESASATDAGFIVFADSMGNVPDFAGLSRRNSLLAQRPEGERPFLDGLDMDLNILAPQGSTVHLVIDPLLGDVINAVGSGRVQLVREEGDFSTYGTFSVSSGDYLFTAGEVFFRRFLIESGTITWDGDPLNAMLNISATYRTRASTEGLGLAGQERRLIPLIIELDVSGRVATPIVDLALSVDRSDRNLIGGYDGLEALLNRPEHAAQYATSVLLTNSFLLSATSDDTFAHTRSQLAFNSLSQLVAGQLNRYLNYALPNVDLSLGVQGESAQDLDVTYGVALRLLEERLIIRGQGIYQNDQVQRQQQGVLDEFVVEVRLNPQVSMEVFYRREGDILSTEALNTSTTGAGLSYQTEFSTWRRLIERLFGWVLPETGGDQSDEDAVAGTSDER
ncbi:MAG: translocation/assembly module TamB domain-containing protein [Rhodothermales bacterium]